MESFVWNKYYETEILTVDEQHQALVSIINKFGELLTNNNVSMDDVDKLVNKLVEYTVYHFAEEEGLMKSLELDKRHIEKHSKTHEIFLAEVNKIYSTVNTENLEQSATSFLKFLMHWLAYHILGMDQDMANQLKAIQSGISPSDAYDKLEQERKGSTSYSSEIYCFEWCARPAATTTVRRHGHGGGIPL